jgi:hypothetical protein
MRAHNTQTRFAISRLLHTKLRHGAEELYISLLSVVYYLCGIALTVNEIAFELLTTEKNYDTMDRIMRVYGRKIARFKLSLTAEI